MTAAVGNAVAAVEAVPAALAAFLAHPDRPADAIRFAILPGGDTDIIAAMTGALAAPCGASALPPPWLQRLEFAGPLVAAADRLAETARPPGEAVGIWSPAATRRGQPGLLLPALHQLRGVQARG